MSGLFGALAAAALWAVVAVASAAAQTSPNAVTARMDDYFDHPNAPETFRALTGRGDPQIQGAYRGFDFDLNKGPDGPVYVRLFPAAAHQDYFFAQDCRPDYAIQTLKARVSTLGADHPYVRRWIEVQRAVFAACLAEPGAKSAAALPAPLAIDDGSLARLQTEDRAYQQASLAFYRGDIKSALADFGRIAHSASPHRAAAIYMTAAIRAGSRAEAGSEAAPLVDSAQSIREVKAILADPSLESIHPIARDLLGWIGATSADLASRRVQVQATLADLELPADRLARDAEAQRRYALALTDIDRLHLASSEDDPAWWLRGGPPADYTASQAMMEAAKTDPMAAWVLFPPSYLQGPAWAPFVQAEVRTWSPLAAYATEAAKGAGPVGFAWGRIDHALTQTYDPDLWSVVEDEETRAKGGAEPALAVLVFDFYHQVRLALTQGDQAALDAAIAHLEAFPFKDAEAYTAARHDGLQYLMTVGRIADARRWRDQVALSSGAASPWRSADADLLQILAEDESHFVAALSLDADGANLALQNNLSIAELGRLAARQDTPAPMRAKFARVAWSRTYALGRAVDGGLDRTMRDLNPLMTKDWTSRAGQAVRPNDRRALLDVLRSPAVNILIVDVDRDTEPTDPTADASDQSAGSTLIDLYNHDDDNWWCSWKRGRNADDLRDLLREAFFGSTDLNLVDGTDSYNLRDRLRPVLAASFAFRSQNAAEVDALSQIPCAPKLLTQRVLDWVRRPGLFETRDGQAEALALAVRTTRYGCYSDGPHGSYSKAAWTVLHQRFAASPWAARTRYWFNCPFGDKTCAAKAQD